MRGTLRARSTPGWDAIWIDRLEREWPLPKGKPRKPAHNLEQAVQAVLDKL
jgi:hypothetical protein